MTRRRFWCRNENIYPVMSVSSASVCKCSNYFHLTAGWGTILSACPTFRSARLDRIKMIFIGLIYWILMLLLCIGWCYSCKHGKRLKKKAKEYDEILKRLGSHAVALRLAHFSKKRNAGRPLMKWKYTTYTCQTRKSSKSSSQSCIKRRQTAAQTYSGISHA